MSCTIVALPFALAWLAGNAALVSSVCMLSDDVRNNIGSTVETKDFIAKVNDKELPNIYDGECNDVEVISDINIKNVVVETPFTDKEILIKTLEEHGATEIYEEYGKISGKVDTYLLSFEKIPNKQNYTATIDYLEKTNIDEKLQDLNEEYSLNVQEESYLNIIEKLRENNMEIESEEVMDDDTIVLTINLE